MTLKLYINHQKHITQLSRGTCWMHASMHCMHANTWQNKRCGVPELVPAGINTIHTPTTTLYNPCGILDGSPFSINNTTTTMAIKSKRVLNDVAIMKKILGDDQKLFNIL
jgi:hypothetical protein